jgi:hypothetical protein
MFDATELLIDAFVKQLRAGYHRTYGGYKPDYEDIIAWAGNMALENIANSDALYHNVEHTIAVTLVGQEILRGKHIREGGVSCEDWLHFIISLLCHNIGYVKGVCRQDRNGVYATGRDGKTVALPEGATDASLTPYRADRAKLFVDERFGGHKLIDVEQIKRNIELTRFPIPDGTDFGDTVNYTNWPAQRSPILQKNRCRLLRVSRNRLKPATGLSKPGRLAGKLSQIFLEQRLSLHQRCPHLLIPNPRRETNPGQPLRQCICHRAPKVGQGGGIPSAGASQ